jgi:CheY-like chemotaxis protein
LANVLIVDDSLFALDMLAKIIERAGHETTRAFDGEQGLDKIVSDKPDLVISDLLMPKIDGMTFLSTIRQDHPSLPVIILSANIQTSMRDKCLKAGANEFLRKPPKPADLLAVIEKYL